MVASVSMKFDLTAALAGIDAMGEAAKGEVRPAAQAGAQVLYEEVKARAPVAKRPHKTKSGRIIQPGALRDSIYQVFSKDNSNATEATYHVSWNAKKAPHGHLVEYGTSRAPAHPFLRPAYDARAADALKAADAKWAEGVKAKL